MLYSRDGLYDSRNNSYSSSPAVSTSSAHDEIAYLEMGPISHGLPTVKEMKCKKMFYVRLNFHSLLFAFFQDNIPIVMVCAIR